MSPKSRRRQPLLAAAAVAAALAITATACGPSDGEAGAAGSSAERPGLGDLKLPEGLPTSLEDLEKWKNGDWSNWDKEDWLREAADFFNPVIRDLWDPERMREAQEAVREITERELADLEAGDRGSGLDDGQGITDPAPQTVRARPVPTPYQGGRAPVGKVFMDTPKGSMVCSGAVVRDPAKPGKSNLVATAGHCVHAGESGGWFRNIVFVPAYNSKGLSTAQLETASLPDVAPYGKWWAKWARTTPYWIAEGSESGGAGASQDFAVMRVQPENDNGKSLEETVGSALPIDFGGSTGSPTSDVISYGYPAAEPYDGQRMFSCTDRPSRLPLEPQQPTMYLIGCTMTAGASGGPWLGRSADGTLQLYSVNSIGPSDSTWLAGPRLGKEARDVYNSVSKKYARE